MKTFNNAEKKYNRQRATAYIVYMMAGSYFHSQKATGSFKNFYLHYAEMPREKQYGCEARVIQSMEALDHNFLRKISSLRFHAVCRIDGEDLLMEFSTGGFESLRCRIRKNGDFQLSPVF